MPKLAQPRMVRFISCKPGAVAQRSVPFDADAGPGRDGQPVVVYSRCRQEPTLTAGLAPTPDWQTARGCDVYELPLTFDAVARVSPHQLVVGVHCHRLSLGRRRLLINARKHDHTVQLLDTPAVFNKSSRQKVE